MKQNFLLVHVLRNCPCMNKGKTPAVEEEEETMEPTDQGERAVSVWSSTDS